MIGIPSMTPGNQFEFPQNFYYVNESVNGLPAMERTPGLSTWLDLSGSITGPLRAMKVIGDFLYALFGNKLYKITNQTTYSMVGTVSTSSGPAQIEGNNTQVAVLICNVNYYVLTVATSTLTLITHFSAPYDPIAVFSTMTYSDNYIILNSFTDKAYFYVTSATGDLSLIDALDFETPFSQSDDVMSLKICDGELFVGGTSTIEVYSNTGDSFPYTRISGAGNSVGFGAALSPAYVDNGLFFLDNTNKVRKTVGYKTVVVSTPKLERAITDMAVISDAIGMAVTWGKAMWYVLAFPTENVTYAFDCVASGQLSNSTSTACVWYKWASFPDNGRHRANCFTMFGRDALVGDYENAIIWKLDTTIYHENGEHLISTLTLPKIDDQGSQIFIDNYFLDMKAGVGFSEAEQLVLPNPGVSPVILLEYSKDDGASWIDRGYRSVGKYGETSKPVKWNQLGRTFRKGFIARHTISDPVECTIYGAKLNV